MESLEEEIKNSFFLNETQKKFFLNIISKKDDIFLKKLRKILETEKDFLLKSLIEYKNRDSDIWIMKQEIIQKNLKRIKELESEEIWIFDLEKEFENIF